MVLMIISCPNCSTTYKVDNAILGPQGKSVQCSNCGKQWHQLPVKETSAKAWVMLNKNVMKNLKDRKNGSFKIHPRMKTMFMKFQEAGIKIHAYTASKLIMTYSHECISNILNAAGVKSN